jgi:hypothetical protein
MSPLPVDANNGEPAIQQVTGSKIFWALLAIAFNAMAQRSNLTAALDLRIDFSPLTPQLSSPTWCLTDTLVDIVLIIRKLHRKTTRDSPTEPAPTSTASEPFVSQGTAVLRIALFLFGVLPQVITIFAMRGISSIQTIAAIFLLGSIIRAVAVCVLGSSKVEELSQQDLVEQRRRLRNALDPFVWLALAGHVWLNYFVWRAIAKSVSIPEMNALIDIGRIGEWASAIIQLVGVAIAIVWMIVTLVIPPWSHHVWRFRLSPFLATALPGFLLSGPYKFFEPGKEQDKWRDILFLTLVTLSCSYTLAIAVVFCASSMTGKRFQTWDPNATLGGDGEPAPAESSRQNTTADSSLDSSRETWFDMLVGTCENTVLRYSGESGRDGRGGLHALNLKRLLVQITSELINVEEPMGPKRRQETLKGTLTPLEEMLVYTAITILAVYYPEESFDPTTSQTTADTHPNGPSGFSTAAPELDSSQAKSSMHDSARDEFALAPSFNTATSRPPAARRAYSTTYRRWLAVSTSFKQFRGTIFRTLASSCCQIEGTPIQFRIRRFCWMVFIVNVCFWVCTFWFAAFWLFVVFDFGPIFRNCFIFLFQMDEEVKWIAFAIFNFATLAGYCFVAFDGNGTVNPGWTGLLGR